MKWMASRWTPSPAVQFGKYRPASDLGSSPRDTPNRKCGRPRAKRTRTSRAFDGSAIQLRIGLIGDRRISPQCRRLSVSTPPGCRANRDQIGQAAYAVADDPGRPAASPAVIAHDRHLLDREA